MKSPPIRATPTSATRSPSPNLGADAPDYARGLRWLRSAADLGSGKAALDLSGLYLEGKGLERSYPQAYLWANIATGTLALSADQGIAADRLARLARAMTPEERTAADAMVRAWQPAIDATADAPVVAVADPAPAGG